MSAVSDIRAPLATLRGTALRYVTTSRLLAYQGWVPLALLSLVVVVAGAVRFYDITGNPPGFFTDEAAIGYNAYRILHTGRDEYGELMPLMFRSFGDYKLGVFVYSVVPFVAVFGLTEFAVRAAGATYGLLAVLTTFLVGRELFGSRLAGLAVALFLAVTPWHVHYSRTGFGELLSFVPLFLLGVYLFVRGVRAPGMWAWAGAAFGLSLYTYRSAWATVPPALVAVAVIYRREIWAARRHAAMGALVLAAMALPILFHLTLGEGDRSQQVGILNLGLGFWGTVQRFVQQYLSHFSYSFLFENGDGGFILRHYLPGYGVLHKAQLPFLALGAAALLVRPTREKGVALLLLLLAPLPGAISDASPISSRAILGSVAAALLSGYGLFVVVRGLSRLNRPYGRWAAAAALAVSLVAIGVSVNGYLRLYHGEYARLSAGYWGWQSGPKAIIEYYLSVQDRYDQLVMDGEFNAPHMFPLFYAPERCAEGRCIIADIPSHYDPARRQLFAMKPHHLPSGYEYRWVHEIRYPDGELAFVLAEVVGRR